MAHSQRDTDIDSDNSSNSENEQDRKTAINHVTQKHQYRNKLGFLFLAFLNQLMIMNIVSTLTRKCVSKMEPQLQNYDEELI